jgi:hypothetical protein
MLIDLDTPEIKYGDGNFKIDKDGNVELGNLVTEQGVISIITSTNSIMIGNTDYYGAYTFS